MSEILEKIKRYSKPLKDKLSFEAEKEEVNNIESLLNKFKEEALKIDSKVIICNKPDEAVMEIKNIVSKHDSAVFNNAIDENIFNNVKSEFNDKKIILAKDIESNFKFELSNISVSISIPEFLIAETGTAVIRSSVNEPRLLSVLTEKSIILAKKEQVLPSMSSFLKILKEKKEVINLTSAYVFITGPSRTADIEKNLVIGVHGPSELYYIIY